MPHTNHPNRRTALGLGARWAAAVAAPALLGATAHAQDKFPSRPITLIAPWPPGGSSDAVMRAFAESAAKVLGVPVVVDNKPGAGGTLGAAAMKTAAPDGYTITQLPLGIYRLPHMQAMPFDPVKDLTHVVCLTGYTFGIACTADAPFKTLQEMVAYANPNPFKGSAEIMQAILGGHIRVMSGTTEFAPYVQSGKLRLLATLGSKRNKAFPNVPTVKESGWDTITESPFGIGAPRNLPPHITQVLHDAFRKTLDDPKVQETLDRFYMTS